ncbi:MAG: hypothetical protein HYZ50_22535 [Deltaproteobacteria bacterium]|nr:hypothetical protein [Deltaproteobacteria bacterium]
MVVIVTAFLVMIEHSTPVLGYRPFISTDAAVADPKEMELELGYFNLERTDKENIFIVPQVVVNYGIIQDWEVVGEFRVEKPPDTAAQFVSPGLFLKGVLKEGVLQQQEGVSVAIEAGPLLPSMIPEQNRCGFEGIGILSGEWHRFTYHLNLGGGVDRHKTNPFVLWGVIAELPILPSLRLVGEVSGESSRKKIPDDSLLFGFIWQLPSSAILLDGGIRKSMSRGAPDWLFTIGLTWSFSLSVKTGAPAYGGQP